MVDLDLKTLDVVSELYSIENIVDKENDYVFNIPIYQRLFVWEEEQVKTLFEDLYTAYKTKKSIYYIGSIIVVKNARGSFDLVDGQQRFTTLWLLSNELKNKLSLFMKKDDDLRMTFSIRDNVASYLKNIGNPEHELKSSGADYADMIRISMARKTLQTQINEYLQSEEERVGFADYVFKNVKMVITEVPKETDLNKLFETLNNRGEQLQQHEILKARLLKYIKDVRLRQQYATLWTVCSKMNEYIERTIAKEIDSSKDTAAIYHNRFDVDEVLKLFDKLEKVQESITLLDVLKQPDMFKDETVSSKHLLDNHPKANADEFEPVRSILTFPQLLLHTLRIFLHDLGEDDIDIINEKELLETFTNYFIKSGFINEENVKLFFKTLFDIRYAFDRYIIKWVKIAEDKEEHLIKDIRKMNQKKGGWTYYLRRLKADRFHGFELLQSILYHSQQNTTQYWLTPFLKWLKAEEPSFDEAYWRLRVLDNSLFSSKSVYDMSEQRKRDTLIKRTWRYMSNPKDNNKPFLSIFESETGEGVAKLGLKFPHYWFYKIEFVLWYYKKQLKKEDEWGSYRMIAKNSLEHIGPQNPRDEVDKVCVKMLDSMGNLVLVTRSINSEYGDKSFGRKKSLFIDKKGKGSLDSLKSDLIYSENSWSDKKAMEHHQFIIELLEQYFKETKV